MYSYAELKANGLCTKCRTKPRIGITVRCEGCTKKHRVNSLATHRRLKDKVFSHYGGYRCACCKEVKHPHFMHIDHKNGGGNEHRRAIGGHSGGKFYRWLVKHNFPEGYQPLCADCNTAKGYFGECPHEAQKLTLDEYRGLDGNGLLYYLFS